MSKTPASDPIAKAFVDNVLAVVGRRAMTDGDVLSRARGELGARAFGVIVATTLLRLTPAMVASLRRGFGDQGARERFTVGQIVAVLELTLPSTPHKLAA